MIGIEPEISATGKNLPTNCATTADQSEELFVYQI